MLAILRNVWYFSFTIFSYELHISKLYLWDIRDIIEKHPNQRQLRYKQDFPKTFLQIKKHHFIRHLKDYTVDNTSMTTDAKMVLKKLVSKGMKILYSAYQSNIYIFRVLKDLRSLLQSLKQNCRKSAQVCKIEKIAFIYCTCKWREFIIMKASVWCFELPSLTRKIPRQPYASTNFV